MAFSTSDLRLQFDQSLLTSAATIISICARLGLWCRGRVGTTDCISFVVFLRLQRHAGRTIDP